MLEEIQNRKSSSFALLACIATFVAFNLKVMTAILASFNFVF